MFEFLVKFDMNLSISGVAYRYLTYHLFVMLSTVSSSSRVS